MRILKSGTFWIGVVTGATILPVVLGRVAPSVKAKLPS